MKNSVLSLFLCYLSYASSIKNAKQGSSSELLKSSSELPTGTLEQQEPFPSSSAHIQDSRISTKGDRNFIITHEGILQYQPVSRSIHDLDQQYKASSTYYKSEVIPVGNDGKDGRALSVGGQARSASPGDNSLMFSLGSNRDTHAAYTSHDEVSVPLHVGFQVEEPIRMNPKGKVLNYEEDLNQAANNNHYVYKPVARQPYFGTRNNHNQQLVANNNLQPAESQAHPVFVSPKQGESPDLLKLSALNAKSFHHQNSDLQQSASSYYQDVQKNQKYLNPYFTKSNDMDLAASDPREQYETFTKQHTKNAASPNFNAKDQHIDETKIYTDPNGGGAKSYVDYMTAGDLGRLESKKYLGGKFKGDIEDAPSGHYEGQIPIHFGFQVEHPRVQYPPHKSSYTPEKYHADKYHSDFTPSSPKLTSKFKVPKVPKQKYVPSVEDEDEEVESDFKHIKIKKYSTNNEDLPLPSTYNSRYSDEIPNPSRHSFKYTSSMDDANFNHNPGTQYQEQQQRSATTNEQQILLPSQQQITKLKRVVQPQQPQRHNPITQSQASQKYYQYIKPQSRMFKKAGTQTPFSYYV